MANPFTRNHNRRFDHDPMKHLTSILVFLLLNLVSTANIANVKAGCGSSTGLAVQILGSGGPIADDDRASAAYLVWINGHSRFMIDTGGGSFLRFGEAGASFEDLEHIAISHLHTDHSADLVAILKSGYFSNRKASLSISGPSGQNAYPGINDYLARLLDPANGPYAYLSGYLDGSDGLVALDTSEVDTGLPQPGLVYANPNDDIEVFALGVPHGPVPALAYRIRIGQKSIVFSGDQNGNSDHFVKFAAKADILVMHMPVALGTTGTGRNLHAPPEIIGKIAAQTDAKKLVLSHFMARSLHDLEENLSEIRSRYNGPVVSARDLACIRF